MAWWPQTWNTQGFLFSKHFSCLKTVQPQGKIVTNKVFVVHRSNICVKQLLTCYIAGVDVE